MTPDVPVALCVMLNGCDPVSNVQLARQALDVDVADMAVGVEVEADLAGDLDGRAGEDDLDAIDIPDGDRLGAQALGKHPLGLVSEDLAQVAASTHAVDDVDGDDRLVLGGHVVAQRVRDVDARLAHQ